MTYRTDTVLPKVVDMIHGLAPSIKETVSIDESTKIADLSPEYDSLDHAEMLMGVEDEWSINITDAEASKFVTIGDLVDDICRKAC